jgi:hypothetical protein
MTAVVGDRRGLGLAAGEAPLSVRLGRPSAGDRADVVWLPGPAPAEVPAGVRMIATSGDGLWSRAPWPARDDLFELPPPARLVALVVGADDELRTRTLELLERRGATATVAPLLTREDLELASVVAMLGDADAATPPAPLHANALPGEAPAVLAARRILIAPRARTTFGFLAGVDHLAASTPDDVAAYVHMTLTFPEAFEPFRVLGALAAERHRASAVYARLAGELRSAPRYAEPHG